MRINKIALAILLLLTACTMEIPSRIVTILDGTQIHTFQTNDRVLPDLLIQAGVILGPEDGVLLNGTLIPLDQPLPENDPVTLQVRRAVTLELISPDGTRTLQTKAFTIGEALKEAGYSIYASDRVDPPVDKRITGPLTVTYTPSQEITINISGKPVRIRSSA